jgi:type IX secretion system PorP/SprF family membrane protein
VVGADFGVSNRSIKSANLQWPSQNNGGSFGSDLPGGVILDPSFVFVDMSAGLLWFSVFDENNNLYFGTSFSHLNRANVSFQGENIPLYGKLTAHFGGEFEVADRVSLVPGVVSFFQGPSFQVNVGNSFKFLLGNSRRYHQAFQLGAWARISNRLNEGKLMDAIILSTRFDYEQFTLGFSYDVNTSSLRTATNGNGAFEFSLLYKVCGPERRGVYCPNF